ncbi:S-adenosylmethionine decarboxylase [Pedobacter sp.]|uniref:S-adenosylmethionine decarboxylase family protein n=1 Tax=Pedobacter sp. TaxID=1411316 RepID=UPI0031D03E96
MKYSPGLHILSEFTSNQTHLLFNSDQFRALFDQLIVANQLDKVGEVYHDFENGGFTAVVCLTESHMSIHTWPEYKLATFDVFLSNYKRNNSDKVKRIYQSVLSFFDGVEMQKNEIVR